MLFFMPDIFKAQHWPMFLNVSTVVPSPDIEMLGNDEAVAQPVMVDLKMDLLHSLIIPLIEYLLY